ncbi:MAG: hypothetical protein AB1632_13025 [Nitrospirota bacterium]
MRYQVKKQFRVRTSDGEMELQSGQVVTLSKEMAVQLINIGKIIPIGRVAYRIYSEILQAFLWVVDTDEDMMTIRDKNITEPIYTANEIRKLKGIKENLKKKGGDAQ